MSVQPQPLLVIPSKPNKLENFTFDCKSEGYSNNPSANRKNDWRRVDTDILHGAESCFDAIIEYALISSGKRKPPNSLTENVCQDLRRPAAGIDSPISQDNQRSLLSPYDDLAFPLVKLQVNDLSCQLIEKSQVSKGKWTVPSHDDRVDIDHEYCPQAVVNYYFLGLDKKGHHSRKDDIRSLNLKSKAKKHLSFMGWTFWYANRRGKREMRYFSPKESVIILFVQPARAVWMKVELLKNSLIEQNVPSAKWPIKSSSISQLKSKGISAVTKKRHDGLHGVTSNSLQCWTQSTGKDGFGIGLVDGTRVLRSRKRARQVLIPGSSNNPRTILSWLIDNNVVLPRAKVHYSSRRDHHPMADGRITRDGIKCSCCQEVFSLSRFEAHAGSSYHRSAANIFLEDGRSLLECQMQIIRDITGKGFTKESFSRKKSNERHHENDYICSVCHYGGDLVLCDHCPSSFHKNCLGLKTLPEGDWFCPSCCCGICGETNLMEAVNRIMLFSVVINANINVSFISVYDHVGCLRKWGHVKLASYPNGTWFCSKQCKKIFLGLQKLLGKSFPKVYSKLNIALGVMHECFEPVKEPHTRRDVVEDVIFCRGSDLNRLNFQGFYTVLLERNDELISVATVRVYGEKVAEVPLIGTRFQYRRLGMCHILMNELEKKLMELGVERLVLPAVPSVLNTWTTSFGFSKMTDSERLRFLDYSFLDFQDTVMCQKLLMKIPLAKSNQSTGAWSKHIIDFDKRGAISEALKSEQVEAEIVAPGPSDTSSKGGDGSNSLAATQQTDPEHKLGLNENNLECLLKDDNHKGRDIGNGYFKCYKRRRILSASGS
ncbi:Increased DNA methylation 1 [Vitis vinifera]|uniref:Increased DNA methylation 1 n=1 Tax=Vitis vinifera TaxID=29760 RepID=A0A438F9F5_VITVI|nr:Increased DNA methylation 1 [Vitis vinifera]